MVSFNQFAKNRYMQYESYAQGYRQAMKNAKTPEAFENNKKQLLEVRKMHWELLDDYYKSVLNDQTKKDSLEYKEAKEWKSKVSLDYFTRFDKDAKYGKY